jgi:hypothetical protein
MRTGEEMQSELTRRHRTTVMVIGGVLALTLALVLCAFAFKTFLIPPLIEPDPTLKGALWIAILFCGLGSVAFRRTRFSAMRLQDIAGVRGVSGVLETLQNTTIMLACLGASIAVMGFIITLQTGQSSDMLRAGLITIAVLLYCYPRRAAWQRLVDEIERAEPIEQVAVREREG